MGMEAMLGMQVAGAALGAYGAIRGGQAEQAAANFQAKEQERAADLASLEAAQQRLGIQKMFRSTIGAQFAMAGASGTSISGGSQQALTKDSRTSQLKDMRMVNINKGLARRGFLLQARMLRAQGRNAMMSGYINAGTQLLNLAGQQNFQAGVEKSFSTASPPVKGTGGLY